MHDRSGTWVGASAKQIARAVRRGETSATAVVADGEIVDDQPVLRNLPLAGVPIAVKENTPVTGVPTWNGSAAASGPIAETDHEVVRRLRGAGAIVLGTTRMPELGVWAN